MLLGMGGCGRLCRPHSVVPPEGGAAAADQQSDGVHAAPRTPVPGVFDELAGAFASARATLSNFLDLVSFEARRAGIALMWMVTWGFVAAICIVAAWLGLMVALAMWFVSLGCAPIAAVLAVVVLNGLTAAALIFLGIGLSRDLLFPATRRQVGGKFPVKPTTP